MLTYSAPAQTTWVEGSAPGEHGSLWDILATLAQPGDTILAEGHRTGGGPCQVTVPVTIRPKPGVAQVLFDDLGCSTLDSAFQGPGVLTLERCRFVPFSDDVTRGLVRFDLPQGTLILDGCEIGPDAQVGGEFNEPVATVLADRCYFRDCTFEMDDGFAVTQPLNGVYSNAKDVMTVTTFSEFVAIRSTWRAGSARVVDLTEPLMPGGGVLTGGTALVVNGAGGTFTDCEIQDGSGGLVLGLGGSVLAFSPAGSSVFRLDGNRGSLVYTAGLHGLQRLGLPRSPIPLGPSVELGNGQSNLIMSGGAIGGSVELQTVIDGPFDPIGILLGFGNSAAGPFARPLTDALASPAIAIGVPFGVPSSMSLPVPSDVTLIGLLVTGQTVLENISLGSFDFLRLN